LHAFDCPSATNNLGIASPVHVLHEAAVVEHVVGDGPFLNRKREKSTRKNGRRYPRSDLAVFRDSLGSERARSNLDIFVFSATSVRPRPPRGHGLGTQLERRSTVRHRRSYMKRKPCPMLHGHGATWELSCYRRTILSCRR
jgi:hypothetical protein